MNLSSVFEQNNPLLAAVFLLLAAMSLVSWYIIFWKGLKLRKEYRIVESFMHRNIKTPDWPKYISSQEKEMSGSIGLLFRELESLSAVLPKYKMEEKEEIISMHLSQSLDVIRGWLDKGLTILASVGSSAPFIGLFGTVWGIYTALIKIAAEGNAGLNVVAGPVGESLVATAIGLFAAIPAVLGYNAFVRLNRLLLQNLRHIAEQMTLYLSLEPITFKETTKLKEVK